MDNEKKKRGRKPKGGKIIKAVLKEDKKEKITHAIILHLKCDISNNLDNNNAIISSNNNEISDNNYHFINNFNDSEKSISEKIKDININYKNNITNTTSSCFWCTEPFNSSPIFIPSKVTKKNIDVYGHFCSPQCASAFLFNEKIDNSIKWERYSFINNIYNNEYKTKITPAPSPYYVLKKYYGNLTIEEYRKIINYNELVIINKPITKITPELHINNNNTKINNI